jgi:hypothetical protein
MAAGESDVVHKIMLALSPLNCTTWKNVRGLFYTLDKNRKVRAGLQADGSSDLIGFKRVKITQDMVGQTVAIFLAVEVKTATGVVKPEQQRFVDAVRQQGGIAGVARSPEDAKKIIS